MAKYTNKRVFVDAEQIDITKPLPEGVQANPISPTGYSYGTLAVIPLPGGNEKIDGFPVSNLDYLVKGNDGNYFNMAPSEFLSKYEVKNGAFTFAATPQTTRKGRK